MIRCKPRADPADHFRLIFLALFLEKAFERRRQIEMIFDGVLALAGHNDDVLDARRHALLGHVLDEWLVHDGQHFFGLCLGGRQKACA